MGSTWTKDQVELALKCLLFRAQNTPEKIKIDRDSGSVTYHNIGVVRSDDEQIWVTIHESDNIHVHLGKQKGMFTPSSFFWRDKEIKQVMDSLRTHASTALSTTEQSLSKCFPEITSVEFERAFLEKKQ